MSYCVHCGVRLEEPIKACPLCHTPVIDPTLVEDPSVRIAQKHSYQSSGELLEFTDVVNRTVSHHKGVFSGILSIIFFVGLLVTLIVDLSVNTEITWSFYTMTSITTTWFLLCFPLMNRERSLTKVLIFDLLFIGLFLLILDNATNGVSWGWLPTLSIISVCGLLIIFSCRKRCPFWLALTLVTADLALFLGVLDLLTPKTWFLTLALPILLLTILLIGSLRMAIILRERRYQTDANGYLYGAISFILLTLGLFGLNIILSLYTSHHPIISWAYFTLIFSVPLFTFCFIAFKDDSLRTTLQKKFRL